VSLGSLFGWVRKWASAFVSLFGKVRVINGRVRVSLGCLETGNFVVQPGNLLQDHHNK
ncbi:hypothetical protein L9F63_015598, partial [Diploptera punctata]